MVADPLTIRNIAPQEFRYPIGWSITKSINPPHLQSFTWIQHLDVEPGEPLDDGVDAVEEADPSELVDELPVVRVDVDPLKARGTAMAGAE